MLALTHWSAWCTMWVAVNATRNWMSDVTSNLYTSGAGVLTCTNYAVISDANMPWRFGETNTNCTGKSHQWFCTMREYSTISKVRVSDSWCRTTSSAADWILIGCERCLSALSSLSRRFSFAFNVNLLPSSTKQDKLSNQLLLLFERNRRSILLPRWVSEPPEVARSITNPHRRCRPSRFGLRPWGIRFAPLRSWRWLDIPRLWFMIRWLIFYALS